MLGIHPFKAVVLLCACLVACPGVARAQFFNQMPSERTLQTLDRSLGRLSSRTGAQNFARGSGGSTSGALSPSSSPLRPRPRGAAGAGYGSDFGTSSARGSGSALLGKRYASGRGVGGFGGGGGGGGGLGFANSEMPGLVLRRPGALLNTDATESLAVATRPSDLLDRPARRANLDELARDYVKARRDDYLHRGWQHFAQGDYRAACDVFSIAQAATAGDRRNQVEVYVAVLCAAVAANQQERAMNALRWLLTVDARTGDLPDPQFLTHFQGLSSRYTDQNVFRAHMQIVEAYALRDVSRQERQALRSVMLWARGDRANALFYARSLKDAPWVRLTQVVERTNAAPAVELPPSTQPAPGSEPILMPPNVVAGQ